MSPKVSVIVPVYNVAEYLGQCLDTILLQTLQDIEVICVDDGSTDDSLNILNMYAMFDERLKVIHQENAGAGPARNRGIKEAKGKFLSFLDSDDLFHPEMLEKMVAKAEEDASDVVVCGYYFFDDKLQKDTDSIIPPFPISLSPADPIKFGNEIFNFSGAVWNKLYRSELVRKNELQFDSLPACNDLNFGCTALALSKKISVLEDCFIHYRINTESQISANRGDHPETAPVAANNFYANLKKFGLDKVYFRAFLRRVQKLFDYHLSSCNEVQKENFLQMLKFHLEPEIFQAYFGTAPIKVSIIIPVYNAEKYLSRCLDSVICQTLNEIEVICVDDGSTDNSLEILNEYAKRDSRIKILHQKNQKQSIARANAMDIASGEYIQFLDADDWLSENCCELLWLYSKIKNTDMLSFGVSCFDEDKQKIIDSPSYYNFSYLNDNFQSVFCPRLTPGIMVQMAVSACLTFYKRSFLKTNKLTWLRKPLFYEDTYFFTKAILKADRFAIFRNKLYYRCYHDNCTVRQVKNYEDYHKILYLTLKYVYDTESKECFFAFLNYYTAKLFNIYNTLDEDQRKFFVKHSYKLLKKIYKKFRVHPNLAWEQIVESYVRNNLTLKKTILFKAYKALATLNNPHLSFSLFELDRYPFSLKILELPIFSIKTGVVDLEKRFFRPFPFEKVCLFNVPIWNRYPRNMKQRKQNVELGPKNSSSKVLIIELNKCHGECLPGYVHYFMELGYGVDVLINEAQKLERPLEMFNGLNVYYLPENAIIDYLNSKQLNNYDICFLNSNIIYRYNCSIFNLIRKYPKKTKILCVEHQLENLKHLQKKPPVLS